MTSPNKTQYLSRLTTALMAIAIFFSMLPFAFGNVSWDGKEGIQWLWADYPEGAILIGVFGLISWAGYFLVRQNIRTIVA